MSFFDRSRKKLLEVFVFDLSFDGMPSIVSAKAGSAGLLQDIVFGVHNFQPTWVYYFAF
jgi:hypothetical protein